MKALLKTGLILAALAVNAPALAQTLPNSTPEASYLSVMSRAGGEMYIQQQPTTPTECDGQSNQNPCYEDSNPYYPDYGGAAAPAEDHEPPFESLGPWAKRKVLRDRERKKKKSEGR